MDKYRDRQEAGVILAKHLKDYANLPNVLILALPRGGVPVASAVAKVLQLPFDIFIVRKLGVPQHEELAMGAIASGGEVIYNVSLMHQLNLGQPDAEQVLAIEQKELLRREQLYRHGKSLPDLRGKTIILIDDGIATGYTMRAAIKALRKLAPEAIVVAVPVAAKSTCEEMLPLVDALVCPSQPEQFIAVGLWYEQFPQLTDEEVCEVLRQ